MRRFVIEVGMALILLVGAGLMMRSFVKLKQVDVGFSARNVLTMRVSLPYAKYPITQNENSPQNPPGLNFFDQLLARAEALPQTPDRPHLNRPSADRSARRWRRERRSSSGRRERCAS